MYRIPDNKSKLDKEIEIIHDLGQQVLEQETMLNKASDACGELDRSITMRTVLLYLLTTIAFSHLHMEPEFINFPDHA